MLGLTILIYATLLGLCWWMIHTIRKWPHPRFHGRAGARDSVDERWSRL